MNKLLFSLILVGSVCFSMFSEAPITIELLNGKKSIVSVNDTIDEIIGTKMHLSFCINGTTSFKYDHSSPIINIENISQLKSLRKVILFMELYSFKDFSVFESDSIEKIVITYGLNEKCLLSIQKIPNLKVLYLNSMDIKEMNNLDFNNTKVEYFEISESGLSRIISCKFPNTLKYLNLRKSGYIDIDQKTIEDINEKNITVVSDYKIDGVKEQIIGDDYYKLLPEEYREY